jgi:tRNA (Thr-GGU) A37 N-methylase
MNRRGVPRQGLLAPSTRATVVLYSNVSAEALDGLAPFSHVWLVFVFSRNTNSERVDNFLNRNAARNKTFPGKIRPPLLGGKRTGLLSTRYVHVY